MQKIIIPADRLLALVPVSEGAAMHRLATRPQMALMLHTNPQGALRKAKQDVRDRKLASPVPADRWMREIYDRIDAATQSRLSDVQRRALCTARLGMALAAGADLEVVIDDGGRIVVFGGRGRRNPVAAC